MTPNTPEAELLTGHRIDSADAAEHATAALLDLGANAVLLKGGHLHEGARVLDRFDDGVTQDVFMHPRLQVDAHGTGCSLSAAIAAQLCQGLSLLNACEAAIDYVARAIRIGQRPGQSDVLVLDHFGAARARACRPTPCSPALQMGTAGKSSVARRRTRPQRCCGCRHWAWQRGITNRSHKRSRPPGLRCMCTNGAAMAAARCARRVSTIGAIARCLQTISPPATPYSISTTRSCRA